VLRKTGTRASTTRRGLLIGTAAVGATSRVALPAIIVKTRKVIADHLDLHARLDGRDTNDGLTQATAFATLQQLFNAAMWDYDTQGFNINGVLGPGTWSQGAGLLAPLLGGGRLVLSGGNVNAVAPPVCTINGMIVAHSGLLGVRGVRLRNPGGVLVWARYGGAHVEYGNIQCDVADTGIYTDRGGQAIQVGDVGLLGDKMTHVLTSHGGISYIEQGTCIALTPHRYSHAFVWGVSGGEFTVTGTGAFDANSYAIKGPKMILESGSRAQWAGGDFNKLFGEGQIGDSMNPIRSGASIVDDFHR
jgi:hypothetical protein